MPILRRVTRDNWPRFAALLVWRKSGQPCEEIPEAAPENLSDPNLQVWAAEAEGRFVGWISLVKIPKVSWTKQGHLYVDELWVAEAYRRRGIAKALMDKAEAVAREMDVIGLRLYVNAENPGAQALYEQCGYAVDGTANFMEKPL